ncbi:hypothetical protein NMY22_g13722 [Coprinellus aureogranulatus]|nr:hypothetical protein NMY22_g13722 [Coprinellus aureogranulatus]
MPVSLDQALCPVCTSATQVVGCDGTRHHSAGLRGSGPSIRCFLAAFACILLSVNPLPRCSGASATAQSAGTHDSSNPQTRNYTALWARRNSNGLEARLQSHTSANRLTLLVDTRTPLFLLIDNDTAMITFTWFLLLAFICNGSFKPRRRSNPPVWELKLLVKITDCPGTTLIGLCSLWTYPQVLNDSPKGRPRRPGLLRLSALSVPLKTEEGFPKAELTNQSFKGVPQAMISSGRRQTFAGDDEREGADAARMTSLTRPCSSHAPPCSRSQTSSDYPGSPTGYALRSRSQTGPGAKDPRGKQRNLPPSPEKGSVLFHSLPPILPDGLSNAAEASRRNEHESTGS